MLYVSTRNDRDAFTAQRALRENRCCDGGMYLPFSTPQFSAERICALGGASFSQNVADILNVLFNTKLNSWDVDFCIGRYPVRLKPLPHRIFVAELWHNPDWNYDHLVKNLLLSLCEKEDIPGDWAKIAVRTAVLFGIFGELNHLGIDSADVAVVSGDFSAPISAWYARKWGLPIGNIICCCNENNNLWDLICHGQMRTDTISIPTDIPEADVTLPEDLERLIYECGGVPEVERYIDSCRHGKIYFPTESILAKLRQGIFISVVSSQRIKTVIPSVYRTHDYLMSSGTALSYSGMLDYRAKTGQTRYTILLSEKSPVCDLPAVAKSLSVSEEVLKRHLQ